MDLMELAAEIGHRRTAAPGEVLMREGDPSDRVVAIIQGRVKVTVATSRGPTAVLGFRGPGDVVGEIGALSGRPRGTTVTAVEDLELWSVPAPDFNHRLRADPALMLLLMAQLSARLADADRRNAEHLTSDTTARVARRLLVLAEQYGVDDGTGRRITLPLTQDELAGLAGSSLEAVAKALRVLRAAGWIETGRRELTIRDLDALRQRAAA